MTGSGSTGSSSSTSRPGRPRTTWSGSSAGWPATKRVGHGGTLDPFAQRRPAALPRPGHPGRRVPPRRPQGVPGDRLLRGLVDDRRPRGRADAGRRSGPPIERPSRRRWPRFRGPIVAAPAGLLARSRSPGGGPMRWPGPVRRPSSRRERSRSTGSSSSTGTHPTRSGRSRSIEVDCSAGTYIRALARDLGAAPRQRRLPGRPRPDGERAVPPRRGPPGRRGPRGGAAEAGPAGRPSSSRRSTPGSNGFPDRALDRRGGRGGRPRPVHPAPRAGPAMPGPDDRLRLVDGEGRWSRSPAGTDGRLAPDKVLVDRLRSAPAPVDLTRRRLDDDRGLDALDGADRARCSSSSGSSTGSIAATPTCCQQLRRGGRRRDARPAVDHLRPSSRRDPRRSGATAPVRSRRAARPARGGGRRASTVVQHFDDGSATTPYDVFVDAIAGRVRARRLPDDPRRGVRPRARRDAGSRSPSSARERRLRGRGRPAVHARRPGGPQLGDPGGDRGRRPRRRAASPRPAVRRGGRRCGRTCREPSVPFAMPVAAARRAGARSRVSRGPSTSRARPIVGRCDRRASDGRTLVADRTFAAGSPAALVDAGAASSGHRPIEADPTFAAIGASGWLPSAGHRREKAVQSRFVFGGPSAARAGREAGDHRRVRRSDGDTGSPEVQIALLTERIKEPDGASAKLSQGQPFAPRPPQARRPAPSPSCLPDEEGQRALPGRHRTARTPPLGVTPPGPRTDPGSSSRQTPVEPADAPQVLLLRDARRNTFPCLSTFETQFGGRTLTIETGKLARLAGGSVTVRYGDTMVLGTANRSEPRPGLDFFPLTVDFEERMYAAGKIPGGFIKREARAVGGGHPGRPPDRPADPAALPRGLQGRHPARHHGPLDGPGERARRPRHDRRVGRADDQRDPVRGPGRRRPHRPDRRRVRGQPDLQPSSQESELDLDRLRHPRRDHDGRGRRQAPARGRHGRGDPVRPPRAPAAHRHPGAAPRGASARPSACRTSSPAPGSVLDFVDRRRRQGDEFVVVDVETTGTDPKMADLVEIARRQGQGRQDRRPLVDPGRTRAARSSATRCTASPTRTSRARRRRRRPPSSSSTFAGDAHDRRPQRRLRPRLPRGGPRRRLPLRVRAATSTRSSSPARATRTSRTTSSATWPASSASSSSTAIGPARTPRRPPTC